MILAVTSYSLLALTLFGIGDYAIGRGGRKVNPLVVNFVIQAMAFAAVTPVALFLGVSLEGLKEVWPAFLIGLAFGAGFYFYVRAMALGPMGIAAPLVNGYAAVTLIASLLFFGVVFSASAIIALAMVSIGAILLTFNKDLPKGKLLHPKTIKFAGISMLIQGSAFAFLNPVIQRGQWYEVLLLMSLGTLVVTAALLLGNLGNKGSELRVLFSKRIMMAMLGGLATGLGGLALFGAAGLGDNIVLPAVVSAASPLVTALLAYFIDKERIPIVNRVGAVAVVAGIVMLNV